MDNPYIKPGCLKVTDYFTKNSVMPFIPNNAFKNIEEMLATFDKPELLEIIHNRTALVLKR